MPYGYNYVRCAQVDLGGVCVVDYLGWLTSQAIPQFFSWLDGLYIVPGVSVLGFWIAVSIICIVVGAILFRV